MSCRQSSISTVEDLSLRVKGDLARGQLEREQGGGRGHAQVRRFRRMEVTAAIISASIHPLPS